MKYLKNTAIIIGFWLVGMVLGMFTILALGIESPLAESINRDLALTVMFALMAWYFKNNRYYIGSAVVLFFGLFQVYNFIHTDVTVSPEKTFSIQSYINKTAKHANKTLPQEIDSSTRFDSVSALPNTLKLFYTTKDLSIDEINKEYLQTKFVTNVKAKNCKAKEYKFLLDNNASIVFHYNDKNGIDLIDIEINKQECNKDLVIDYTPIK